MKNQLRPFQAGDARLFRRQTWALYPFAGVSDSLYEAYYSTVGGDPQYQRELNVSRETEDSPTLL